ncbi:hypothetical protein GCM10010346_29810 [Streptomyces chryseus]|uniref:Uncharacterized protein n=1 Tax=Streptomyces chryseus TaxID=68186 RepID=A0ABQ3DMJ7_9ACTN|nr:hypothetical protein GCM10010346_29810 [Streptomyces chryseus]
MDPTATEVTVGEAVLGAGRIPDASLRKHERGVPLGGRAYRAPLLVCDGGTVLGSAPARGGRKAAIRRPAEPAPYADEPLAQPVRAGTGGHSRPRTGRWGTSTPLSVLASMLHAGVVLDIVEGSTRVGIGIGISENTSRNTCSWSNGHNLYSGGAIRPEPGENSGRTVQIKIKRKDP